MINNNNRFTTSTGKTFEMNSADGSPMDCKERTKYFKKNYIGGLEVGQQLKHGDTGITLKRIK